MNNFDHIVSLLVEPNYEIILWCLDNCEGNWWRTSTQQRIFYFQKIEDAMAFKLTWI